MPIFDFRSDTVTKPTPEMLEAMVTAPVGDDVYGDDPTVNRLEVLAAEMVGKQAALFTPSGTFGNQAAIMAHTRRGDELIAERGVHIVQYEVAGAAALAGVQIRTVDGVRGAMTAQQVEAAVRDGNDIHQPPSTLLCLENAHTCGAVLPMENTREMWQVAQKHGMKVHLDGARLFNAATALGVPVTEITRYCDSVQFCLSKGLCAPVGSMLAGDADFIARARKFRKMMGGGMRQVGILAACGVIALEKMALRLGEDHANALYLADRLEALDGVRVLRDCLDINMVYWVDEGGRIADNAVFVQNMLEKGFKLNAPHAGAAWRFATHNDVNRGAIDLLCGAMAQLMG